ncbi:MAG: type II and III secretion system protein family protein [Caulobacteraceae bacterium]|nr:type II and III secretion system protein family protein [Caulobacteraceae bacterium]
MRREGRLSARRPFWALGFLLGLALTSAWAAVDAYAASPGAISTSSPERAARNLQLGVGKSVIVDLPEEAAEIYVGDPKIANAIVRSARRIYVSAIANGQTTIFALAADGRRIATIEVSVRRDVGELVNLLNAAIPNNDIHVRTVADSIILTGSVASAGDAQKAFDIASGFTADTNGSFSFGPSGLSATSGANGKVINSLTIRGLDQISLRVTVAEVQREVFKQLGVSMSGAGSNGNFKIDNPFTINGALSATEATLSWVRGTGNFSATIQAFERQGVARTLAEPTVTAVSGESAKFMAGGTIPIPNSQSCTGGLCQIGFIQQPYGVTLNFTPVVLSEGRIQLRIATEVTEIDYSRQLTLNGLSIPGFRTRNNVTTVDLPSGGSIATAGLINTQTQQAINGFPALMNLPILGALFRSRDYQRNETELLIVVTPYVVHAINARDVERPDQNFEDASDPQAWFLGRVNRIYAPAGKLQPMPGYAGPVGFITE